MKLSRKVDSFFSLQVASLSMDKKKHIWYESRFWVIVYALVAAVVLCMQFSLGLMQSHQVVLGSKALNDFVNGNAELPIDVMSWGWTALISLYCGSDRVVDTVKSTRLAVGQMSMGDVGKIRGMVVLSLTLFIAALVFNFMTDKDYALSAWASAFAMTVISLAVGNKMVKIAGQYGAETDKNNNGVPDDAEASYKKWCRKKTEEGVAIEFQTFDYFLDDPDNVEWEKKYRPSSVSETKEEKNDEENA